SSLEVTSFEADTLVCHGVATLRATGSGAPNTELYWYENDTIEDKIANGSTFKTPELSSTTSYWVSEVFLEGDAGESGLGKSISDAGSSSYAPISSGYGMQFTANEAFTLVSVTVLSSGSGGDVEIFLKEDDDKGQVIDSKTVSVVGGGSASSPVADELELDFEIPGSGTYYIYAGDGPSMIRDSGDSGFPYSLGSYGEITNGYSVSSSATAFYFFYEWTIGAEDVVCESSREEVVATVGNSGDIVVNEPLPYTDSASTKDYDNNYAGVAGDGCASGEYLEGSDVVYQYSPSQGAVYSIELSDLSSDNASVFVYESCFDIGESCYAGEMSDGSSGDFGIDEVIMNDGQTYFIVISTETSSSTDYTLTIDEAQIDCADYTDAPEGEEEQYSQPGFTLEDLKVKGSNLTWYDDSTLGNILSETTP